jgi:phosphoglycolate phosphatase
MLRAAMMTCGADAASTAMIGDTSHDIAMALAAGVHPLGVGWGFHTVEEQAAAGALHIAADFPDLEAALDRFASIKLFA